MKLVLLVIWGMLSFVGLYILLTNGKRTNHMVSKNKLFKKTQALAFNVPSNKLGIPTPSNNIAVVALDNDSIIHSLLKHKSFIYCIIN